MTYDDHIPRPRRTARENNARARDRGHRRRSRDASAGWRREYRAQRVALPDGDRRERRREMTGDGHDRRDRVMTDDGSDGSDGRRIMADGGQTEGAAEQLPSPGETVLDVRTGDELIVVDSHPDTRADEHTIDGIEGEPTVADVNPAFPDDSPVVECLYASATPRGVGSDMAVTALQEGDLRRTLYTFPAARLATEAEKGGEQ